MTRAEIGVSLLDRQERLAILVFHKQAANGARENVPIDFDLPDGHLAIELFRELADCDRFDDQRKNEETEERVKQHEAHSPDRLFAPSRRKSLPQTEEARVHATQMLSASFAERNRNKFGRRTRVFTDGRVEPAGFL